MLLQLQLKVVRPQITQEKPCKSDRLVENHTKYEAVECPIFLESYVENQDSQLTICIHPFM